MNHFHSSDAVARIVLFWVMLGAAAALS